MRRQDLYLIATILILIAIAFFIAYLYSGGDTRLLQHQEADSVLVNSTVPSLLNLSSGQVIHIVASSTSNATGLIYGVNDRTTQTIFFVSYVGSLSYFYKVNETSSYDFKVLIPPGSQSIYHLSMSIYLTTPKNQLLLYPASACMTTGILLLVVSLRVPKGRRRGRS